MSENKHHEDETPDVSYIKNIDVAHEESDVSVSAVAKFTVGLAVVVGLTCLVMWGMFSLFAETEQRKEPPPTTLMREKKPEPERPEDLFPEPRLQRNPIQDLDAYQREKVEALNSYGWVDAEAGLVRIPIAEAKKRLLEKGLPHRQEQSVALPDGIGSPVNQQGKQEK
jgi:hypothetical protein